MDNDDVLKLFDSEDNIKLKDKEIDLFDITVLKSKFTYAKVKYLTPETEGVR